MKSILFCFIVFLSFSCSDNTRTSKTSDVKSTEHQRTINSEFQEILDSLNLKGSILIFDTTSQTFYSNDFEWAQQGHIPASTYKIPHTIIGLETRILSDSFVFKYDGAPRNMSIWEQDLGLKDALQFSCVPCYQSLARLIGVDSMKYYLEKLDYGTMKFDSSSIDQFWLVGDSRISQFEQIQFLQRLFNNQLPISEETNQLVKRILVIEEDQNSTLSAKTGWSIDGDKNNGWFVGYLETEQSMYYFATNIEPTAGFVMSEFSGIRIVVVKLALQVLQDL